jgi:hypothetical protein
MFKASNFESGRWNAAPWLRRGRSSAYSRHRRVRESNRGARAAGRRGRCRESLIAPRPAAIIDADRLVGLRAAIAMFGGAQGDFAQRHAEAGMQRARQINLFGIGQRVAAVRLERIFRGDHNQICAAARTVAAFPSPALPGAGSTGHLLPQNSQPLGHRGTGSPHREGGAP